MVFSELNRYLKSKYNIICLSICAILVSISYYFTNLDKDNLYYFINNPTPDFNLEAGKAYYEGINGFTYLFDFLFSSDLYIILVVILSLSVGLIVGNVEFRNRSTSFGNMIFSRIGLRKGSNKILLAQILYVIIYITLLFFALTSFTLILYPVQTNEVEFYLVLAINTSSSLECLLLIVEHMLKLIIYMIFVVVCTYGISYFANNKYIIAFTPLLIYLFPLLLCSILGNLITPLGNFISHFVADKYLLSIYNRYALQHINIGDEVCLPLLLFTASMIIYSTYLSKIKRNYL